MWPGAATRRSREFERIRCGSRRRRLQERDERRRGEYSWDKYDRIVDLYRDQGIEVIARLDWSPEWASTGHAPGRNNLPDDVERYADFVGATVKHFGDKVRFYQSWNEPNLLTEWGEKPDDPVDPAEYG